MTVLGSTGCPTAGTTPPVDAGEDGTGIGLVNEGDGGTAMQPIEAGPCEDAAHCISGTASLDPSFALSCVSPQCTTWQVDLFGQYPAGTVSPIGRPALVALDGTWSIDGVDEDGGETSGYYVQATAVFVIDGGQSVVTAVVGPVSLPSPPLQITLRPVNATAYESQLPGGPLQLDWALARVYDPSSGAPITSGADVAIQLEAGPSPLQPTAFSSGTAYYAAFPQPPPAQGSYTLTVSHPAFGDAGYSVQLSGAPASFDGGSASAAPVGSSSVQVTWTPQPAAGYELVELFASQGDAGWVATPAFISPAPVPPGQTSQTSGALDAGLYLVNVSYTVASCPEDAGGCVESATVVSSTVTVP